jgi:hypothetical protein
VGTLNEKIICRHLKPIHLMGCHQGSWLQSPFAYLHVSMMNPPSLRIVAKEVEIIFFMT